MPQKKISFFLFLLFPFSTLANNKNLCNVSLLNRNESALGASPNVIEALQRNLSRGAHRYPEDPRQTALRRALAQRLLVPENQIVLGHGSDELIATLPRVLATGGKNVVSHRSAYFAFKKLTVAQGFEFIEAPLGRALNLDVDTILNTINTMTAYVILANPINPTGGFLTKGEIERLASELEHRNIMLVLDSAYREYVTDLSVADPYEILKTHSNIIILGTFSKIYGLAGLRIGYLVARAHVAALFEQVRQTGNVSTMATIAALEALSDTGHLEQTLQVTRQSLLELHQQLPRYGFETYPSQANFVMVDIHQSADELVEALATKGILVLSLSPYGLPTLIRISAGRHEDNQRLFQALDELIPLEGRQGATP